MITTVTLAVAAALALTAAPAHAATPRTDLRDVRALAHFDRSAGQSAESIAPDGRGGAYVGMLDSRQVVHVDRAGRVRVVVTMPTGSGTTPVVGAAQVTGVARTARGSVYFLYAAGRGGRTGIWQLHAHGRSRLMVPLPADSFPNALVLHDGRFLVSDSTGGRIFTAPLQGGRASVWSSDPTLRPRGFFGANGLKVHDGAVWASNSDRGTIVDIPVLRGGAAGHATVRAGGMPGIDDFDFTGRSSEILAAVNQASRVVRVRPDGSHVTVLDGADGLQGTSAVIVRQNRVWITDGAHLAGDDPNLLVARLG